MRSPLVVSAALASLWPSAAAAVSVAFVGLEGLGLERATVQPIERLFERALGDQVGSDLVRPDQITARLLDPRLERLRTCIGDALCLVDLGGILEVEVVVSGTLTRLGENFVVVVKAIDVLAGSERARVRHVLAGDEGQLLDTVRTAARQLFDPSAHRGDVVFTDLPAAARLEVDGQSQPAIAGEAISITAGKHAVTITVSDLAPRSFWIEVLPAQTTRVDASRERLASMSASLDATPAAPGATRPWQTYWPQATVGLGGALVVGGSTLGILAVLEENAYERSYREHSRSAASMRRSYDRGRAYARWTNITLATGGVVAGIGIAGWLLPDNTSADGGALGRWLDEWGQTIALGVGGGMLATGGTLGALAWREEQRYVDSYRSDPGAAQTLADSRDRGQALALWTNVLCSVGAVLVTAGVVDWLFLGENPAAPGGGSP